MFVTYIQHFKLQLKILIQSNYQNILKTIYSKYKILSFHPSLPLSRERFFAAPLELLLFALGLMGQIYKV